ncbi:Arginyl-tRNA--protein transferase 1 [Myotisia sp. PD_48]|nr:Arginyl-tRNA--protein transferase 1 [Myotisia sp. PD_48]
MAAAGLSQVSFFSPMGYQKNSCGYCKTARGSPSYYASSTAVRAEDYEELINRGWRRSGALYYKPDLQRACCPYYTLRLDPTQYKPRRDQKKALNRWNKFVLGQKYIKDAARLCPKSKEEKRYHKQTFDLSQRVHEMEYSNIKRPRDPKSNPPRDIEPAHKFEVNIESDSFSQANYDPAYEKYEFGKSSAMRELALAIEMQYQYYHMGYYIHSCPKMRYKANFRPQSILDPVTLVWYPYDKFLPELDKRPFVTFSDAQASDLTTKPDQNVHSASPADNGLSSKQDKKEPLEEDEMSLFDLHVAGIMTAEEIKSQLDLDHWKLFIRGKLVDMIDLVGWEDSDMKDPQAIKGIIAELAAALGPKVVNNSAVMLFQS